MTPLVWWRRSALALLCLGLVGGCANEEKFKHPVSKINGKELYPCAIVWHGACDCDGQVMFCPDFTTMKCEPLYPTEEIHRKLGVTCAEHEPTSGW